MTNLSVVTCIVCGKSLPTVINACYHCQRPMHQECGTQKQVGGNYVSCPDHTYEVAQAQQQDDYARWERLYGRKGT